MLCWGERTHSSLFQKTGILTTLINISPGFLLVIGTWYRTEEHASRALFWQSANAGFGIISDLTSYGIGSYAQKHGGMEPWRGISLFLGGCTIVAALICFALLGSPKEVIWMTKDEKRIA